MRLLRCYERAPLRVLLGTEAIGPLDIVLVSLMRRALTTGSSDPSRSDEPSSGWRGNLLFLGAWTGAIVAVALLVRG